MKRTTLSLSLVFVLTAANALAQPKKPAAPATAAPAAPAQPDPPPGPKPLSETLTGEAKADYERAKMLIVGNQDWKNALINFQAAYDKSKDPRLMWNIAACYKSQQKYAKTVEHIRRYLSEGGDLLTAQDRKDASDLLAVIEPLTTTLELTVNEADAKITLDGEALGNSPVPSTLVDVSAKTLAVTKDDFEPFSQKLDLGGAKTVKLNVSLVRIKHEGKLTITAGGDNEIYLDGALVGKSFWSSVLKSGGYQLKVVAPGKKPYQTEIVINDRDDRTIPVTLEEEKKGGLPIWAYIVGGAVLAGASVTAIVIATSNKDDTVENTAKGTFEPGFVSTALRF